LKILGLKLLKSTFSNIPQKDKESFLPHIKYIPKKGLTILPKKL